MSQQIVTKLYYRSATEKHQILSVLFKLFKNYALYFLDSFFAHLSRHKNKRLKNKYFLKNNDRSLAIKIEYIFFF